MEAINQRGAALVAAIGLILTATLAPINCTGICTRLYMPNVKLKVAPLAMSRTDLSCILYMCLAIPSCPALSNFSPMARTAPWKAWSVLVGSIIIVLVWSYIDSILALRCGLMLESATKDRNAPQDSLLALSPMSGILLTSLTTRALASSLHSDIAYLSDVILM